MLLDQLDDFRLPNQLPKASDNHLPPYVPQANPQTQLFETTPDVVALTLSRFISKGGRSFKAGIRRVGLLREGGAKTVVLVGTSLDGQLEAIWKKPIDFVNAIRQAKVDLVLGPAFSIYVNRPPLERIANRSRNLLFFRELAYAGIQSIPAVGFVDEADSHNVGEWVKRFGLRSIFIDLQSADSASSWDLVCKAIPRFIIQASTVERIVVNGVANPSRVIELASMTRPRELVLTNGSAFQLARSGRDYYPKLDSFSKKRSSADEWQLFKHLHRFYCEAVARRIDIYEPCARGRLVHPHFV